MEFEVISESVGEELGKLVDFELLELFVDLDDFELADELELFDDLDNVPLFDELDDFEFLELFDDLDDFELLELFFDLDDFDLLELFFELDDFELFEAFITSQLERVPSTQLVTRPTREYTLAVDKSLQSFPQDAIPTTSTSSKLETRTSGPPTSTHPLLDTLSFEASGEFIAHNILLVNL